MWYAKYKLDLYLELILNYTSISKRAYTSLISTQEFEFLPFEQWT